jgi:hypothetical protein
VCLPSGRKSAAVHPVQGKGARAPALCMSAALPVFHPHQLAPFFQITPDVRTRIGGKQVEMGLHIQMLNG